MKRRTKILILTSLLFGVLFSVIAYKRLFSRPSIVNIKTVNRVPQIWPDYSDTVIPPNIAPLNFLIKEKGNYYYVRIYSKEGNPIEIFSKKSKITIPLKSWHKLLEANRGYQLHFDVFVKTENNRWNQFSLITNKIAGEDIDAFVVYRKMHPTHVQYYGSVGIYQRNLENFDESLVLDNGYLREGGCLNCHTFCRNDPNKMLMGVRGETYGAGTLFVEDGVVSKIGTKFGYTSWHPSGRLAVYSIINLPMFFHTARSEIRDTVDLNSLLAYYLVGSRTVKVCPKLSRKDHLETWPAWSADGRWLYFCSAAMVWASQDKIPPDRYKVAKYNLVRISYDINNDRWGEPETVISTRDTGLSIGVPRTSPDGRWLSFCMFDYGYFPTWQQSSDLCLVDLRAARRTGRYEYRRLEINSDQSESWHSWSSNSRWIVFSSKRDYGVFTKPYISYVDETGRVYKPLVVPQKDPTFYDSCLKTYNTPELVIGPVPLTGEKLAKVVRRPAEISVDVPVTMATPKAGADPALGQWLGERE